MSVESWISFWTWLFWIGLLLFYVLAVVVVPLGWRDIVRLLRELTGQIKAGEHDQTPDD